MLDIAIFFLAKHPEIQEKAFEEIQVKIQANLETIFICKSVQQIFFNEILFLTWAFCFICTTKFQFLNDFFWKSRQGYL